jgi:spore coat polysaccharide biosynthesis protein SpsF (cytidylyltransferase family)
VKVAIVQARMTSKRLPGKVMLSLGGEPAIRHVLRRCKEIPGIDKVVCAVPVGKSKPIRKEALSLGVTVAQGSEHDVLGRYRKAALLVQAEIIMRITADCPLIDPEICGRVLDLMEDGIDYASNVMPRNFPKGFDCECFTYDALERAHKEADDPYDREHVTSWMQRNLYCVNLEGSGDTEQNLCLDELDDYLSLSERF